MALHDAASRQQPSNASDTRLVNQPLNPTAQIPPTCTRRFPEYVTSELVLSRTSLSGGEGDAARRPVTLGLVIDWATEVFKTVEEIIVDASNSPWFLLLLFGVALFDSIIPIVPSEFSVIAGAVAAGAGTLIDDQNLLSLILVIVIAALGAYIGDSLAYWIGNRSERLLTGLLFRGEKGAKRLESTARQIRKRGGLLLVTARFIPGGRTALTVSCGLTGQPFLAWFTRWDLLATTIWATYAGLLGFFVADAIESQSTALWLAFGLALSITVVIEAGRFIVERVRGGEAEQAVS